MKNLKYIIKLERFCVHPAGTEPLPGVPGSGLKSAKGLISVNIRVRDFSVSGGCCHEKKQ